MMINLADDISVKNCLQLIHLFTSKPLMDIIHFVVDKLLAMLKL